MLSQIKFVVLKLFYLSLDLEHIFHLLAVEVSFTSSCWMTIIKITSNELKFSFISTSICRDIHSILKVYLNDLVSKQWMYVQTNTKFLFEITSY